jgi:polysaccharide biosynthesis protein PslH
LYGVRPALVPNSVDIERFEVVPNSSIARMRSVHGLSAETLLFSGFYAYPPNREAIDFLVKSIMPALRKRHPCANLALTGGGAPYDEAWIKNTGALPYENFAAFVAGCGIAVAPIFSGSGTRLKVLEAMAAGLPLVATDKAVEGLGLRGGEHFLKASSESDFVNAIDCLYKEPAIAGGLRAKALEKVAEFGWPRIASDFAQTLTSECNRQDPLSFALMANESLPRS